MVDYREILRLDSLGHSQRSIALEVQSSRNTVASTLCTAKAAGVCWPLDDDVTNQQLQEILFPGKYAFASPYTVPDFAWIHSELARSGVTLSLLWSEYGIKVRDSGGIPYQYTQFCEKYRRWARVTKATMRISHKPGDELQVDWAGDPLYITDSVTGEETPAYLFVAVLPCSCYAYAEICADMRSENWLLCHVHAFEYFGGATRLLTPDNCKTSTVKNTRYETILNRSYDELAVHYDTAVIPARPKHPDDKAMGEGTVKFASTWILAALRNRKFFSIADAKDAVTEKLKDLNERPFKNRIGCRRSAFLEEEKSFLRPLPPVPYEPAFWLNLKVGADYLISDRINKYSVPYDLIGENVDVRITRYVVEVYFHEQRVAVHTRQLSPLRDPIIKPEHMPEAHRRYLQYNADEFLSWAAEVGPNTKQVTEYFLHSGKEEEQGFKSCASLAKLKSKYDAVRLEDACARVLALSSNPTIRNITLLIKSSSGKDQKQSNNGHILNNDHGITRGAAYYSRGGSAL